MCTIPFNESGNNKQDVGEIINWMGNCSQILSKNQQLCNSHTEIELNITILLSIWLIKLINPLGYLDWTGRKLISSCKKMLEDFPSSHSFWLYIFKTISIQEKEGFLDLLLEKKLPDLRIALMDDFFGVQIQNNLPLNERKRLAVNYTSLGLAPHLLSLVRMKKDARIIDPFCGTGRLISASLDLYPELNPKITINDINPTSVVIAVCRILLRLGYQGRGFEQLTVSIGDAFEPSSFLNDSFDFVLINPPFTRVHRIDKKLKNNLNFLQKKYEKYLKGQMGLHIYSFLLADSLLKKGGILAAILPAAIICSNYSQGIQDFLIKEYKLEILGGICDKKSFSDGSGIREIFLLGSKTTEKTPIAFLKFKSYPRRKTSSILMVKPIKLKGMWNWSVYLTSPALIKFRETILANPLIRSGKDLELNIVRGVEMYGPDFFFVPNSVWSIKTETESILSIYSDNIVLNIPKSSLIRSLRKPGKYLNSLTLDYVKDFALSISPEDVQEQWLEEYEIHLKDFAKIAQKKFGDRWLAHIYNQLAVKQPQGHIFLIDKQSINSSGVLSHFSEEKLTCTKNFYVIKGLKVEEAKILSAWLNSSWFLLLYITSRREIAGSYGRLQISDYKKERLFINPLIGDPELKNQIIFEFDKLSSVKLESIIQEHIKRSRYNLDIAIGTFLGFNPSKLSKMLKKLYIALDEYFNEVIIRDTS